MTDDSSEQPPVERARVDRQFKAEVDLHDVELPDWEFITKVDELLSPYANMDDDLSYSVRGRDSRGSYSARDLEAFREEHADRGEGIEGLTIRVFGRGEHGLYGLTVHYTAGYGRAEFEGGDEVMVNGLAARVERLAAAARERAKAKEEAALRAKQQAALRALEEQAARQPALVPAPTAAPIAAPTTRPWNHPWVVTIVGGAVAAVIAGVILYFALR
jgi:hypothetical protein